MCDTLCTVGGTGSVFAKNSDRPPDEAQVVEAYPARPADGTLRTQYLEIPDAGACAVVGSRPAWLWGFEHGVNEHRVAIGNEAVYTTGHAADGPPALIGMDLVRLGLERGRTAEGAIEAMTVLLERHGQGGSCHEGGGSYDSSFLVADPTEVWVLETSGRSWAAKRSRGSAAISNRLTLDDRWDRASGDVAGDFQAFRDPAVGTGFADVRLGASQACLAGGDPGPRELTTHLRHHGRRAWGAPGGDTADVDPPPGAGSGDGEFSICMHVRGAVNTTAGMVCDLPSDPGSPLRAWVCLGSPCASVFVPIFPPDGVPAALSDEVYWRRFATLRSRVEADDAELARVRKVLAPLEAELWAEADETAGDPAAERDFVEALGPRLATALDELG